ncbi:MAG: polyphosphate kinase 2 [Azospirillaceae bacterium]
MGKKSDKKGAKAGTASKPDYDYDDELARLQGRLALLQRWVRESGARIVVVFEGRDAAGKGGVIKRLVERVSPRVIRVVALPAPTDRERTQLYFQRYFAQMPAAGEVVIFDRSWYNRAGVERVMGFCTDAEAETFLEQVPAFERQLTDDGIILIKYFLTVGQAEQERRFRRRIEDPVRQWKLSPMDLESYRRWWDYTRAYDAMLHASDTPHAPWTIVPSDNKKQARLNCIAHFLDTVPYREIPFDQPELGERQPRPKDCPKTPRFRAFVPERY